MNTLRHIAIIMDGNGRWGLKKYKSRLTGHHKGVENVKPIINFFLKKKIKILTLYALSLDNFKKRDKSQIENIFKILKKYLLENLNDFKQNKIYLNFIGELNELPINLYKLLKYSNNQTRIKNYRLKINIAFNYSSKKEIINAAKSIKLRKLIFNEKNLEKFLYTETDNNPDIIIRTGGYSRLSDFLLWQASYSELFFVKKLWPDFRTSDLQKIIKNFYKINRNFGS
jgi:undecaprenyl diphosphate synthase